MLQQVCSSVSYYACTRESKINDSGLMLALTNLGPILLQFGNLVLLVVWKHFSMHLRDTNLKWFTR